MMIERRHKQSTIGFKSGSAGVGDIFCRTLALPI